MKKDPIFLKWRILGAVFMMFFVIGCSQPTIETPKTDSPEVTTPATTETTTATTPTTITPTTETKPYYVKNSKWENVDITKVSTARAVADPSVDEALEIIATYNAENNDDQLRLYTTDIPIDKAPTVDIYYAKANNGVYIIEQEFHNIERSYFATYRQSYQSEAEGLGCVLFVDKIPETAPIPVVDTRTRHEKYSIYMINRYDKIVVCGGLKYEKHIDEIWDPLSDEVKAEYNNDIDNLMNWYISAFNSEAVCQTYEDAPWRVVSGQIYVEPTE